MSYFLLLLSGLLLLVTPVFGAVTVSLDADKIQHPLFQIQGTRFSFDEKEGRIALKRLDVLGYSWKNLALSCVEPAWAEGKLDCLKGRLSFPYYFQKPIPVSVQQKQGSWFIDLRPDSSQSWKLRYDPDGRIQVDVKQGDLQLLHGLVPGLSQEKVVGRISGRFQYYKQKIDAEFEWAGGGFSSNDGRRAAETINTKISFTARALRSGWQFEGDLKWLGGGAYIEPLFLEGNGQVLNFKGSWSGSQWALDSLNLDWPDVGKLTGSMTGSSKEGLQTLSLLMQNVKLDALGKILILPFAEAKAWPAIALSGLAEGRVLWNKGKLSAWDLSLNDGGLTMSSPNFSIEGVSGELSWGEATSTLKTLSVEQIRLGRLESGAFQVSLQIEPEKVFLAVPAFIPILDSQLVISHMGMDFSGEQESWQGKLGLSLHPLSLEKITEILGFPVMGGLISANLPSIHYHNGTVGIDGDMVIQVFDGYLRWTDLQIIDLFGTVPRVKADVFARHLNLGQLTQTFSFGQITGFIDADVKGLEIAGWQPLAFDASIISSPGDYPRKISQRAVADITAVGGGGAAAAIQASVLRFFEEFGYRQIALSCRLENGICYTRGVEGADRSSTYTIIQGGGIPALTVIGYNRAVRWDELVNRVKSAIHNSSGPVIK